MNPLRRVALRAFIASTCGACIVLLTACAPEPEPAPTVPSVFVSPVRNDSGAIERVLYGSLRPRVESDLGFRIGGRVSARSVELGRSVRAGQVLGRIDPADVELAVHAATEQQRAAEVEAVQAASDAARMRRLLADGSVAAADAERQQARADAAAARLEQARRQVDLARNRAGYAMLTAPFDGVVTAVRFELGQVVGDGQAVLSLAKPGELEVQADIPEAMVAGLGDWQASARLGTREGVGDRPGAVPLRLREIAPSAASASRTYRARFAIDAMPAGADLRMGMTAELRLVQPGRTPGAELPVSALLVTGTLTDANGAPPATTRGAAVWVVDARTGVLRHTPVQLLSQSTDRVRVGGLPEGALVVTVGAQKLDAGLAVQAVPRPLAAFEASGAGR